MAENDIDKKDIEEKNTPPGIVLNFDPKLRTGEPYILNFVDPKYKAPNTPIPDVVMNDAYLDMCRDLDQRRDLTEAERNAILNIGWLSSGHGGYYNQIQTFMTCLDRYRARTATPNAEHSGVIFMTRPRLCLQSSNLRSNRIMTPLDTDVNTSMAFAIRCLLDTNFGTANGGRYASLVKSSPLFDHQNPFMVPLCNAITSFSGGQDPILHPITTEGGFFQEAQSFAGGYDRLARGNYQLNLTFQDVSYGPVLSLLHYWQEYIGCVTRGTMMAYADDIDAQRLNYTVSFYRFLLDPSHRYITHYAKFTGCWPTNVPLQNVFNYEHSEIDVPGVRTFSVQFQCNVIEYQDYAILMDFNRLVKRYCPDINNLKESTQEYYPEANDSGVRSKDLSHPDTPITPMMNWMGIPFITSDEHGFRLEYRYHPNNTIPENSYAKDLALIENKANGELTPNTIFTGGYYPEFEEEMKTIGKDKLQYIEEILKTGEFERMAKTNNVSPDSAEA